MERDSSKSAEKLAKHTSEAVVSNVRKHFLGTTSRNVDAFYFQVNPKQLLGPPGLCHACHMSHDQNLARKMVHPEPCKELTRRLHPFVVGIVPLLTFIYPGFEQVAQMPIFSSAGLRVSERRASLSVMPCHGQAKSVADCPKTGRHQAKGRGFAMAVGGLIPTRCSSREVRISPFSAVYFSRGALPQKE